MAYYAKYPVDYKNHVCTDKCSKDHLDIHEYCRSLHANCTCCPTKVVPVDEDEK